MDTWFIQNNRTHEAQKKNTMPRSIGSDERYMSPVVFSETVFATSQVRTTGGLPGGYNVTATSSVGELTVASPFR